MSQRTTWISHQKEILENAIRNYTGTVLYVSHDRYFINQTATRIIELRDKQLTKLYRQLRLLRDPQNVFHRFK